MLYIVLAPSQFTNIQISFQSEMCKKIMLIFKFGIISRTSHFDDESGISPNEIFS